MTAHRVLIAMPLVHHVIDDYEETTERAIENLIARLVDNEHE